MPIFLAIPLTSPPETLKKAVEAHIEESDRYQLTNNRGWLIRYSGTSVELSNHLKISGQPKGVPAEVGSALVTLVSSYYGRAPTDMWEWIQTRWEK